MSIIGQGIMLGTFTGNYQTKTVIPNASTQLITPDSGYDALANITITGDSNFTASNIVNGVTIWGITGTYSPSLSSTTVTPNGASFTITPSGTVVGFNQVSVVGDSNLTAANIKSGVTIYGKQGTYAPSLQSKSVTPNAAGFTVTPDSSYYGLSQVVVSGNANLTASNIKSGVSIFGITGSYAPSLQTKTVTPNAAGFNVIPDTGYYGLSQVTISGNANLTSSNIKSGVSIFGVTGSYAPALQSKTVTPNAAGFTVTNDTGYYGLSQVNITGESNLTSENIKAGVYMWNIIGSYAPSLQKKTTNPTQAGLEVTPDSGYYGLSKVTINGDSNFTAANIACGVTIWGVIGTHQGGSSEDLTAEITNYRDLSNTQANTITNIISNLQNKTGTTDHTLEDQLLKGSPSSSSDRLDYENNRLTSAKTFTFAATKTLRSVTMANIQAIPQYCCAYCDNMTTAIFPNATSIGSYAFTNCFSLTTIDLSKILTIGTNAFIRCNSMTQISLPNATSIANSYIFAYCNHVTSVYIPKITTLGAEAFNGCTLLTDVDLPNITATNTYSFYQCNHLTSITLPKVANVANQAFRYCTALESFEGPVTNLWYLAFGNCALTNLTLTNTTTVCALKSTNAFANTPIASGTGNIYVPSSLVDSYKAASNWSTYASQIYAIGSE